MIDTTKVLKKITVMAPGRTCLFGDHQDYLSLPVIACAIDRYIWLKASKNDKMRLVIDKPDIYEKRIIDILLPITNVDKGDHLLAAVKILSNYGCVPRHGYDIVISGNVAINAGTSSSSAVILAWVQFLVEAYGCNVPVTKEFLSKIGHEAEVVFHNAPGGKMDQYSIGLGHIMYMKTGESNYYKLFKKPLPGLIVAESGIPKDTTGVLSVLKENALLAIQEVKQKLLDFTIIKANKKDVPKLINYISKEYRIFLKAAILNHDITQRALVEFQNDRWDFERIGALMNEHHHVLKEYLDITVPQIDNMIDSALGAGALGAKIVGSGRGGSIVVLSKDGDQDKIIDALIKTGAKDAYAVKVDQGVRVLDSE